MASCFIPTMELSEMGGSMSQRWQPHPPQGLGSTSAGLGKPVEGGGIRLYVCILVLYDQG